MSSIQGLPSRGSDVTITITRVHLHPLSVVVEFWGKFSQEKTADYERLSKDIQSPGNRFQELEGNPGDQCLAQVDGTWYRSRIVSRNGSKYSVFLIDKGMTSSATRSKLAWGKKEHFQLAPEVEFCVLANVLPLSPESRWSPVALDFLKSLAGKSVTAYVQDVLVQHRTFLLHIPSIARQMYEMGFAKKLSQDLFQDFVLMTLQSHSASEASPGIQQLSKGAGERLHKQELFMYPELPGGTVETVIVTEVTNPQRIFCQLKVFSQELKKLSEQLTQSCEGRVSNCIIDPEMAGFPCAARGADGKWYRSVLQQVFPTNNMVEVLNVDFGTKQFVQVKNVRPLAAEFFRMPVVTYICSLHGIIDKGVGWTTSQIDYLRCLLLYKTVIAKFEYQSISEGVHYVTLYGDDSVNMNNLFGAKESCFLECDKSLGDYTLRNSAYSRQPPVRQDSNDRNMLTSRQAVEENKMKAAEKLPAGDLPLNSSHVAVVQHVSSPSQFWIQTQNYTQDLDELMDGIYHLYKDSPNKDPVRNPTVGLYCVAKSEDGEFYRATVTEVCETQVKVFYVDYGNTEVVDRSDIRMLPAKFKKLPWLALKCILAGVRPKEETWGESASEFFFKAVTDKSVSVHVTAKHGDSYVVQLTDPEAQGEQDVSTLMVSAGLAERSEIQTKAKVNMPTPIMPPAQCPAPRASGVFSSSGMSFLIPNPVFLANTERRVLTFKEHMFPIGSVLDVTVSYIESPNDFWCQLAQNTGYLKLLMRDIQAHYAGSEFEPNVETACVARHPDNGMWYRALVIHKHEAPQVDVLFVDYGQMETVSLFDLRRIRPEFLTLHGQAFRCSLLNPIDPTSAINEWNGEAVTRFQKFVETAVSNFVILKCTIFAVMYSEQKIVFNIVDLETPFESVCTSLANLVKSAPPKKATGPSFRLDTYYYSTHNVKTGTEEQVTVTCVSNTGQFYCQLEKNVDVMKDLKMKVSNLCRQLENVKLPAVFGTLCFARYTDGEWYRGQIKATKPAILVNFVDYGDTIEVEKCDLLPVPREANDIMSVPVQAVVCGLSDVPVKVPGEVNSWFETNATECKFRALVVAREPDGKLLVELYHGNTQINAKIKKMFQIKMHTEEQVVNQGWKAHEASANHDKKTVKGVSKQAADMGDQTQMAKKNNFSSPKPPHQMRDVRKSTDVNLLPAPKPTRPVYENSQKVRTAPLELYKPPHQRQSCGRMTSNSLEPAGAHVMPKKEKPTDTESESPDTESQNESNAEKLPKLSDLPLKPITPGLAADVYVSHCNSPLSFYVQCLSEEEQIFSLVEKLNDPRSALIPNNIKDARPGDLVQAEFPDDSLWYRAVVREIHGNTEALVEFVDFGNTAMTLISKIGRLHKSFLELPVYSTHCMLSSAASFEENRVLDPDVVSAFKDNIGDNAEKVFRCEFIRQVGSVWEVSLEDSGVSVVCEVNTKCPEILSEKLEQVKEEPVEISDISQEPENTEKSLVNPCCYHQQEFLDGQQSEVYITVLNDDQTFWCQSANSEELDKIMLSVSEVGDDADHNPVDPGAVLPGNPCIARFSDDQLWYRAEVINTAGDELSVVFIDYGNKSQVNITDVREVPPVLLEIPPQAFLCELEGFDKSRGCWDSRAYNEISTLTADKLLQLNITRVTRADRKTKCFVRMECEGQVLNEVMKTWWKSFTTEHKPDTAELTSSYEPPLQHDPTVDEDVPPEDPLQQPEIQAVDSAVSNVHPETDHSQEHSADEPTDPHRVNEVSTIENSPENREDSEDSAHSESFVESPKDERDSIEGLDIVPAVITPHEDILPDETILPPLDNKQGPDVLSSSCNVNAAETDKGTEEQDTSVVDSVGPEDFSSPLDENLVESMDGSETTKEESLLEETNTSNSCFDIMAFTGPATERDYMEAGVVTSTPLTCMTTAKLVPCKAVNPSKHTDLDETIETTFEVSKENQDELVLPSIELPVQQSCDASIEQEAKAGDDVGQEELPCVATQDEDDSIDEEEASDLHEDTHSALLADVDAAASELHADTVSSSETSEVGEVTSCEEQTCSMDVCTADPHELSDEQEVTRARNNFLSSVAAEEICITVPQGDVDRQEKEDEHYTLAEESTEVHNESLESPSGNSLESGDTMLYPSIPAEEKLMSEDQTSALQEEKISAFPSERQTCRDPSSDLEKLMSKDQTSAFEEEELPAFPSDTEPQTCRDPSSDLDNLVEELTCLVGDICLTDNCPDRQEAETATEDGEQQENTPPQQEEDFEDSELTEETASSVEDSFEVQLSKITHLSLIISGDSADVLAAERQAEE
ncbi:tudor domain-containing 6 isoform X2 [Amphiprion ocellaris]|uniref:Tudor domain-containing protein n=1 Tax=Amphiprion ocellaris TaxID=80972 RepID=A0A3Q1BIZ4_AMPOC|nr:tudor domain-containing 6 isoform X2 [Amphiprion ocellaris]